MHSLPLLMDKEGHWIEVRDDPRGRCSHFTHLRVSTDIGPKFKMIIAVDNALTSLAFGQVGASDRGR